VKSRWPLFENLPDSLLPPLHLLDEAEKNVECFPQKRSNYLAPDREKLLDFGVEVKVVAPTRAGSHALRDRAGVGVKGSQIINSCAILPRGCPSSASASSKPSPAKLHGLEIPNPSRQIVKLSEI